MAVDLLAGARAKLREQLRPYLDQHVLAASRPKVFSRRMRASG